MEIKPNANQLFTNIIDICDKTLSSDLPFGFALAVSVAGFELQPFIIDAYRRTYWIKNSCSLSKMKGRAKVSVQL